jgi:hypothetical protein
MNILDWEKLDWKALGAQLRQSALDAFDDDLPSIATAYSFLLDNAELFTDSGEWPLYMPDQAPAEMVAAYYKPELKFAESERRFLESKPEADRA